MSTTPKPPAAPLATILAVDDDRQVLHFLDQALNSAGYRVLLADSGWNAIEAYEKSRDHIHLLLTDLKMPNLDGAKAAAIISAERPGIRVLVISGHASDDIRKEVASLAFLRKPFVPAALREKIRELLGSTPGSQPGAMPGH